MTVVNGGWFGGNGSAADAIFEGMHGGDTPAIPGDGVTVGPMAEIKGPGVDKIALVLGTDNNPGSSQTPGGNRMVQENRGDGGAAIQQSPEDARGQAVPPMKVDSGPKTTAQKIIARHRLRKEHEKETRDVSDRGSILTVKEPAPVPSDLVPESLAMGRETSAMTGSGPQMMFHEGASGKVAALLKIAGATSAAGNQVLVKLAEAADVSDADSDYITRTNTHPLKLAALLDDALGDHAGEGDWCQWEPETIHDSIVSTFGVEPSPETMARVMAVKVARHRPEAFFDRWRSMEKISVALANGAPVMDVEAEDVPVEWLSNAVAVVGQLVGNGDFGPEVVKYAAARLYDQGYVVAPTTMRFADEELGRMVANDDLRSKVILAYARVMKTGDVDSVGGEDDPVAIQARRLLRNNAHVLASFEDSDEQLTG